MLVKENVENISKVIEKIFSFVRTDEDIQKDLTQYINSMQGKITSESQLQAIMIPYVFDRKMEDDKKVSDIFLEKNQDITPEEKQVLEGFSQSISSVFEIKKVDKDGFQLYNLVNEIDYKALTLVKMTNFRGIVPGQYIIGRIFPYEGEYYLVEINNILPSRSKSEASRLAVLKQLEHPELLYENNEKKLAELEKAVQYLEGKFKEYFKKDEFLTTTEYIDDLLGGFNDFVENGSSENTEDIEKKIIAPEKYGYFEVKEVTSGVTDISEAASKGFSSHEKVYDIGVIFDSKLGLLVLPFFATFRKIFEVEDYKSINGYKECILNYINSDKVPPTPLMRVYNEHKDRFTKIISEVLELEKEMDINELIQTYKAEYFARKRFSSPTVLYSSKAFNDLMGFAAKQEQREIIDSKVGRNDPCPCGSGKKYKKCCLNDN